MPQTARLLPLPTTLQNEEPMEFKMPSSMDLHRILNQLLIRRANLSAQYFNAPLEDVTPLPVEQSFYFSDPMEGLLVVRSTKIFEELLETHEGSFLELSVLFYHQLFREAWGLDTRVLKAVLFKRSIPLTWPDRKPDSSCMVFIKESPLEIRLWTPITAREAEIWRKSKK